MIKTELLRIWTFCAPPRRAEQANDLAWLGSGDRGVVAPGEIRCQRVRCSSERRQYPPHRVWPGRGWSAVVRRRRRRRSVRRLRRGRGTGLRRYRSAPASRTCDEPASRPSPGQPGRVTPHFDSCQGKRHINHAHGIAQTGVRLRSLAGHHPGLDELNIGDQHMPQRLFATGGGNFGAAGGSTASTVTSSPCGASIPWSVPASIHQTPR